MTQPLSHYKHQWRVLKCRLISLSFFYHLLLSDVIERGGGGGGEANIWFWTKTLDSFFNNPKTLNPKMLPVMGTKKRALIWAPLWQTETKVSYRLKQCAQCGFGQRWRNRGWKIEVGQVDPKGPCWKWCRAVGQEKLLVHVEVHDSLKLIFVHPNSTYKQM